MTALIAKETALTAAEQNSFARCEKIIAGGLRTFQEVGTALLEIQRDRLYRQVAATFEEYCRERWGFTRQRAHQLISASKMSTTVDIANERQARALGVVPEADREAVVRAARAKADRAGRAMTADDIRRAAKASSPAAGEDAETPNDPDWEEISQEFYYYAETAGNVEGFADTLDLLADVIRAEAPRAAARLENMASCFRDRAAV